MEPIYPSLPPNQAGQTLPGQYIQPQQGQFVQQPQTQPGPYVQPQIQPGPYVQPQAQPGPYIQPQIQPGPYIQPAGQSVQFEGQILQPEPSQNLDPQGQPKTKTGGKTNASKATTGGAKYGGSEAGSALGGLCCPVIGNIIGNCVGEKVGEKVMVETGLDKKVSEGGDKLASVIGQKNVDRAGDIALTAFGYAETETCVCCPCLPASQILLVIAIPFFFFNLYKLGEGVSWDGGCTNPDNWPQLEVEEGSGIEPVEGNATGNSTAPEALPYPCQQGFHYLVVSSAVWLCILPCWICGLFGNCWRQCCCCCCDPIVIGATITDLIKRCCCECGKFNLCSFIWYTLCAFHVIWAVTAVVWLITHVAAPSQGDWVAPREVWGTVVASVVLDFVLAGSELFHKIRLLFKSSETKEDIEMEEQSEKLNSGPHQTQYPHIAPMQQPSQSYPMPQPQYQGMPTQ